jgi:hypothetical protein
VCPNPTGIFAGFEGVTIRLLRGDRQFEVINPPGVEPVTVYAERGPDELSPLQQMLNGSEEVLWWGRPVVYAGTAVVCVPAALPGLTAAGGSAASGGLLGLGLTEGAGGLTFTSAAINQGVASVLSNSNNVGHIFHSKHLLEPLLLRYGSQAGVLTHVLNQLNGRIPPNGAINTTIDVGGYVVRVTGQVVNGIPMISNVWIPMGPHP